MVAVPVPSLPVRPQGALPCPHTCAPTTQGCLFLRVKEAENKGLRGVALPHTVARTLRGWGGERRGLLSSCVKGN